MPSSTTASNTKSVVSVATEVPLAPVDPWVYTIDVKFGTNNKPVPMLVDTGSWSFWAAAESCSTCGNMVNALVSDSACTRPYDTSYGFGTGGFSGCIVNTTVEFGPYKMGNVAIAAADKMEKDLAAHGSSFSGMFGLAMQSKAGTTTPMEKMLDDGLVDDPWVGLRLQRHKEGDSELVFGDALKSEFGDPAFHAELEGREGKYNVTLDSFDILGVKAPEELIGFKGILLDSGTSNIVVPEKSYYKILQSLSVDGKIPANPHDPTYKTSMLRCTVETGADAALSFTFGGVAFPVPWKDIVGAEVDLKNFPEYNKPGIAKFCEPRLQLIKGSNNWILGDAFLVNVYHAINTQTAGVQMWRLKQ